MNPLPRTKDHKEGEMEGAIEGGLQGYWRREKAHQPQPEAKSNLLRRRKQALLARLGGRRRSWRIKVGRKIRFLPQASSRGILRRIKSACMRMMLGLTGAAAAVGMCSRGGGATELETEGGGDYDERKMIEIYRSVAAQAGSGSFGCISF